MFALAAEAVQAGVPAWLAALLAGLIPIAGYVGKSVGKKLGVFLVQTSSEFVEAKLKAAKHDELVPVVEALKHGLIEGGHEASLDLVTEKAGENGAIHHPVIQQVITS